jgi:hypothetical protein
MPDIKRLLTEAPREFMSDMEKRLKKKLIALLRDDGKGHRHAKYAERLEKFDIQIVPLKADPTFTAAISFDRGIIMISEGFLNDPATFYQLNVLLRHELAHNLLMHQVRMAYKLGETAYSHTRLSAVLHQLQNIIADDEISNRKYSEEDKIIVRNMVLNGRVIGGLVTEDHRKSWINLTIEEMYDKVCEEIEEVHAEILAGRPLVSLMDAAESDPVKRGILGTYIYTDSSGESILPDTLENLIKNDFKVGKKRLRDDVIAIIEGVFGALGGSSLDDTKLANLLSKITKSSPVKPVDLFDDGKVVLHTPEEKQFAIEVLKKYKSEFLIWYEKVLYEMGLTGLSEDQLRQLLDIVSK